jgi:hypothetical protein
MEVEGHVVGGEESKQDSVGPWCIQNGIHTHRQTDRDRPWVWPCSAVVGAY